MPKIPTIQGSKFLLRELNPEKDKESLIRNINDPEIMNRMGIDYPYTQENWEWFLNKHKEMLEGKNAELSFVIDINDEVVGCVSLSLGKINSSKHVGKFGYWLAKKHWGKGIMSEAVKLVCDYAFKELGLKKLKIDFLEDNKASARVAEKNGFEFEAKHIKEAFKENKYQNIIITSKFVEGF
jgi:[ribosomal protein S5]-alanine N-acetyltransferase